ncbi:MAG: class I SAM-dependent methyltransferase [Congregibacter sp.]
MPKSAFTEQRAQADSPGLSDVPETMLMTLYSRATEAMRADTSFADPEAVRIFRRIDYPFRKNFGLPEPSMALRASVFDDCLRAFLKNYPGGQIVNLGEGLETQRFRVNAGDSRWFSVDLPESIAVRERFIEPDQGHQHIACSALDERWMASVPGDQATFIAAQGLLMYLPEADVKRLLWRIGQHFDRVTLVFDVIPRWVSRATVLGGGLPRTAFYKTPPMPWGISRQRLPATLRRWIERPLDVTLRPYPAWPREPARTASRLAAKLPGFELLAPGIAEVSLR